MMITANTVFNLIVNINTNNDNNVNNNNDDNNNNNNNNNNMNKNTNTKRMFSDDMMTFNDEDWHEMMLNDVFSDFVLHHVVVKVNNKC